MRRMTTKRTTVERMTTAVVNTTNRADEVDYQGMKEDGALKGVVERADGGYWVLKKGE